VGLLWFCIAVCYVVDVTLLVSNDQHAAAAWLERAHNSNIVLNFTMKLLSLATALIASSSALAFAPAPVVTRNAVSMNMAAAEEYYIDEERRFVMNLILVGSTAITVGAFGIPYIAFFFPPGAVGGGGGVAAKDALGNDLFLQSYLETHPAGDRSLAQGLKGDAT
jgi:cytochrome b6-f complex iron-sulfur subunit